MNNAQTINNLIMQCAKYKKDAEYLAGERDYWKQQASVTDGCDTKNYVMPLTRENVEKFREIVEADSREKLEEDVRQYANPEGNTGTLGACWERKMIEFLDRQAAITERECDTASWNANYGHVMKQRDKLQERVDELEAELKEVTDQRNAYHYDFSARMSLRERVKKLEAENAELGEPTNGIEGETNGIATDTPLVDRDPVEIMRECGGMDHGMGSLRKMLGIECVSGWQMRCLKALADMVERDYVLREHYYKRVEELGAERNELKSMIAELNRTCTLAYDGKWLTCSECGESLQWFGVRTVYKGDTQERALGVEGVRYCAFCGSRIEGGESE